jgi:GrpB-like predicted nucleotidyltransferase (UPF0157 family)
MVAVVDYDPQWPIRFTELRNRIWPHVRDLAIAIEHVGSTAVPGLPAKPVIDVDVVIPSRKELGAIVTRLEDLGYQHRGDLGIEDREAFWSPNDSHAHHLYVCVSGSVALRNHLVLRDHLRRHPEDFAAYASLKKELAARFAQDVGRYVEGKTEFIAAVLAQYGFGAEELSSIRSANQLRGPQ